MERVTDEEAGEGGWFWNEQVGSYRPPGSLYCRECGVLIQDYDHLYVNAIQTIKMESSTLVNSLALSPFLFVLCRET
jgi:hypothetical protein